MDAQTIEIIGRNKLINELLKAGLEVALPMRDRGIDLIAYVDIGRDEKLQSFVACPLQMKAATLCSFGVNQKYEKFPNLILTYVWYLDSPDRNITYALTYAEAFRVAEELGWTKTASWDHGNYTTNNPSKNLLALLEPHQMTPDKWWNKVTRFGSFIPLQ